MNGTLAGWHADPYNRHELRYFDGSVWTFNVSDGGTQSIDDPTAGTPAVVPQAATPSSVGVPRATAQTPAVVVHHRSRWPWVLLGIFIFMVLGFGGCAVISVVVLSEAADEISEAQERHAISQTQFESIQVGTPRATVLQTLGKSPTTTSSFESEAEGDFDISSDCIYYWESGETFGNWYQFCFDAAGNLRTKSQS
jgi:hypothetical protein